MIKVSAMFCYNCQDTIFSRSRHDYRGCSCGKIHIDGGFDYMKGSCDIGAKFKSITMNIKQTKNELIGDYNSGKDLYGRIPYEKLSPKIKTKIEKAETQSIETMVANVAQEHENEKEQREQTLEGRVFNIIKNIENEYTEGKFILNSECRTMIAKEIIVFFKKEYNVNP